MTQTDLKPALPIKNVESPKITGNADSAWGIWERIVPDQIADDPASQNILQITYAATKDSPLCQKQKGFRHRLRGWVRQ